MILFKLIFYGASPSFKTACILLISIQIYTSLEDFYPSFKVLKYAHITKLSTLILLYKIPRQVTRNTGVREMLHI